MEFKKKTIIWEDNNEPPKDYIWAKKDGKFYEYSYATRSWIESKLIKTEESDGSGGDGGGGDSGDESFDNKKFGNDVAEKCIQYNGVEVPENYLEPDYFLFNEYDSTTDSYTKKSINNAEDFAFAAMMGSIIPVYEENPYDTELGVLYAVQDDDQNCMMLFGSYPGFTEIGGVIVVSSLGIDGKTYYMITTNPK